MSVQPPSKGWNILGGVFLGGGGVLLVVLGGVCSYFMGGAMLTDGSGSGMWPLLLLSLATLGGGVALIYQAVRLLRE